jgi:two-component system CheB/CheR fusion protein
MRLGRLDGYAKIAQDLTSLKRSVDKDREVFASALVSAEQAVASNDMKDEFLAVMSHELKHPLSLIQVNAQMLSAMPEAQPHPRLLKVAASIQASVKAQARIIDDLLDLSRTRQGKLALNIAPVYLRETLQGSFDWAAREAAARELDFQLVFEDDDALLVEVDPVRIQQVVMNLLSNALKFTPAGGRIVVEMGRVGDEAMVRVVDNGRGIPAHFLPHVFGLFRQVNTPTTRQEGGLGIGLALVDGIVRLHGGRVSAGSKGEGKGATFTVYLPLKEVSGFAPLADDQAHVPLRGLRVLVVEDSRDLLESFCALLQLEGADVTPAPSGERALEAAEQQDFDLVLSDIGMPLMDGYMFLRALRQRPRFAKVPAIALTGFGSAEDAAHSVEAGFDAHLSKPVDIRRLQALVAELGVQPRQGR